MLLYELLTGRKPYSGESALILALHHATEPVPSVRASVGTVPQALDQIIAKAMAKSPSDRYANGGEMLSDLRMMQDALRFGKSMTWPRPESEKQAAAAVVANVPPGSAGQKKAEPEKPKREKRPKPENPADVPGWLRAIFIIFVWVVIVVFAVVWYNGYSKPVALQMPDLKNQTVDQARQELKKQGVSLTVSRTIASDGPANVILRTDPGAGEEVLKGGYVRATISGGSRFVEVPDLRGLTIDKAKQELQTIGLDLDNRINKVPNRDVKAGLIVSQAQAPRGKYERGTKIEVDVSSGRGRDWSNDPNADRKFVYTLTLKLTKLDKPVRLKVEMTDARGTKTIIDNEQNPNDAVPLKAEGYGSEATFRIFYDGELVKQMDVPSDGSQNSGDSSDSSDSGDNQ